MQRKTLQVGTFAVNCTLLVQQNKALIIDPGQDADEIGRALEAIGATPVGILLTHAHFDHIGGIAALQKRHPALPVGVSPLDTPAFGNTLNQMPPDYPLAPRPANLCAPDAFAEAFNYRVIETPGHTPGGVCYYFATEELLLSGDTLFAGSVGRTDFPGGDMATLMQSLEKLKALPDNTRVIPGHGPETTIAAEKRGNPFLQT